MIDRERLRAVLSGRFAHRHEGFGWRLLHNDVRYPPLLTAAVRDAYVRTHSFFDGLAAPPDPPVDVLVRSRRPAAGEPRALYVPPRTAGRPVVYLNLYNRDRLPLDSAFYWETIRAIAVHEFAHAWIDAAVGRRPLPAWMEEGTARFVERSAAPRSAIARGPSATPPAHADAYSIGLARVEFLVGRFGFAAWLDALRDAARYVDGKRTRARRAIAAATDGGAAVLARHSKDMNRHLDRLLIRRFGLGVAAVAAGLKEKDPLDRPASPGADPFDRIVVGRIDAGAIGSAEVAVALRYRAAHLEAPVLTAVARGRATVQSLLARALSEGRPVHEDALLAFRLATGAFLHRPIPPHLRRAVLDRIALPEDPHRANVLADEVVLVRATGRTPLALAGRQGLLVLLGEVSERRARGARIVEDPELHERIARRLVPGECPPTAWNVGG